MKRNMRSKVTIHIGTTDNQYEFGPGMAELMARVQASGSLRGAAESMGMAYSKAWRIMKKAEYVFNRPLLVYVKGGRKGGGAFLTEFGLQVMQAYQSMQTDMEAYSDRKYVEIFFEAHERKFRQRDVPCRWLAAMNKGQIYSNRRWNRWTSSR